MDIFVALLKFHVNCFLEDKYFYKWKLYTNSSLNFYYLLIFSEKLLAVEVANIFVVLYEIWSFNTVFRRAHK